MITPTITHSKTEVLVPQKDCYWAQTMILNPAIIDDTTGDSRLHMLFRASGPCPEKTQPGKDHAYPIFIGYAISDDNGVTWQADFSRPALAPNLEYDPARIYTLDGRGQRCINYANGGIEDPRLIRLDGRVLLTVACRLYSIGAYWFYCRPGAPEPNALPDWISSPEGKALGRGVSEDVTVNLLYEIDFPRLKARDYDHAFHFLTVLTDPQHGDNRDVMLFPEKMRIHGKSCYVMLHRPVESFDGGHTPGCSIWIAAAESLYELSGPNAMQYSFATAKFCWESNRIGASWPPIRLNEREWLLGYHGKQDETVGYTQSFMILEERPDDFPIVRHRLSERLLFASEPWEQVDFLGCPCVFSCSGLVRNSELIMGYGAADEKIGIARTDLAQLVAYVRQFDADGKHIDADKKPKTNKSWSISANIPHQLVGMENQ